MSSSVALPFCVPHSSVWECLLLCILASTGAISVLDFARFNRAVVASHCFDLHLPDDIWCGGLKQFLEPLWMGWPMLDSASTSPPMNRPKKILAWMQEGSCLGMFIAALFLIAPRLDSTSTSLERTMKNKLLAKMLSFDQTWMSPLLIQARSLASLSIPVELE